tara:strand:- start:208 stop:1644 length:1437 start_codon:yes stop_codon:yes gene_type:complete
MKYTFILLPIFIAQFIKSESSPFTFTGYSNFSYLARLQDRSLINIPYRMGSLNFEKQTNALSFNGNFTLEYNLKDDSYFLETSNPQDFTLDMREFYITYSKNNSELKIGKQIHSWGNVDENSPLDNASALDYYYMFFGGVERKLATLSAGFDYFLGDFQLRTVFSPIHSTNRLPLGNDDFPVELPIYPKSHEIIHISSLPYEGGFFLNYSSNFGELSFSSYSGYDRIFNFSGVNEYYSKDASFFKPSPDLVFGYRKTNILGFGATILSKYLTLRFDIANFVTRDKNKSIERPDPSPNSFYDSLAFSYPISEDAQYQQYTVQIDAELPFGFDLAVQYFVHDLKDYNAVDTLPNVDVNIPGFEYDPETMQPKDLFIPGMGVPVAILTDKAIFIILKKNLLSKQINLTLTSMIDAVKYDDINGLPGYLNEMKIEYSINQDLKVLLGVTSIKGSEKHPDGKNYQFKKMEDFSHSRFELKYYF